MATARSSAGDPARTLALLWRHEVAEPVRRGPRPALDVDAVVDAAVGLADDQGLDAVTMRAVADAVDVSTMSLYSYVPGKAELLDCMLDRLQGLHLARLGAGTTDAETADHDTDGSTELRWRGRVRALAEGEWALHLAHPWLCRVSTTRPVLGPGAIASYEHGLHAFDGTGLDDVTRDAALTLVLGLVDRCARLRADSLAAAVDSADDDQAWWSGVAPGLVEAAGSFPLASRVGAAAGQAHGGAYDAHHAFEFGLTVLLDGLEALVAGADDT